MIATLCSHFLMREIRKLMRATRKFFTAKRLTLEALEGICLLRNRWFSTA